MSSSLGRLGLILGLNAVPFGGLLLAEWTSATALALYWAETLIAVLATAACIAVHRRLTRRRGHWRPQLGLEIKTGSGGAARAVPVGSFLAEFLIAGLVFSAAHAFLLVVLLSLFLPGQLELRQLVWGAAASLVVQLLGLAGDLVSVRDRPFSWIRERAQQVLARSVLIHLAILAGMALLYWQGHPPAFFLPFAVLKLLADLASLWPRRDAPVRLPDEPPTWMARLGGGGEAAAKRWRRAVREERSLFETDEETVE